jgi:hypothetical protein
MATSRAGSGSGIRPRRATCDRAARAPIVRRRAPAVNEKAPGGAGAPPGASTSFVRPCPGRRRLGRRAGQLAGGDDAPDLPRPEISRGVPQALGRAALALEPGAWDVEFQDDDFLHSAAVAADDVQAGPRRFCPGHRPRRRAPSPGSCCTAGPPAGCRACSSLGLRVAATWTCPPEAGGGGEGGEALSPAPCPCCYSRPAAIRAAMPSACLQCP